MSPNSNFVYLYNILRSSLKSYQILENLPDVNFLFPITSIVNIFNEIMLLKKIDHNQIILNMYRDIEPEIFIKFCEIIEENKDFKKLFIDLKISTFDFGKNYLENKEFQKYLEKLFYHNKTPNYKSNLFEFYYKRKLVEKAIKKYLKDVINKDIIEYILLKYI